LTLVSNNKNVDTQEHICIRARRDCERARQSGCRLSVACETKTKYTHNSLDDKKRERDYKKVMEKHNKNY